MAMQPPLPYKIASGSESIGQNGICGIKIEIHHSAFDYNPRNPDHDKLYHALYKAKEMIEEEMTAIAIASDPKSAKQTAEWKSTVSGRPSGSAGTWTNSIGAMPDATPPFF